MGVFVFLPLTDNAGLKTGVLEANACGILKEQVSQKSGISYR